ncbi:MAG TPA: hypothetical protein VLC06_21425 [Polyangia bacterium]|nr:hypothetical protein [Polyangia bacterium]
MLALARRRLPRYERAPGKSTERHAEDVEVVLDLGDGLREPVKPSDDEFLVHATAGHVLHQGVGHEGASRHVVREAIGSDLLTYGQRDPRLYSGSASHLFFSLGLSATRRIFDLRAWVLESRPPKVTNFRPFTGSCRRGASKSDQLSWQKLEGVLSC